PRRSQRQRPQHHEAAPGHRDRGRDRSGHRHRLPPHRDALTVAPLRTPSTDRCPATGGEHPCTLEASSCPEEALMRPVVLASLFLAAAIGCSATDQTHISPPPATGGGTGAGTGSGATGTGGTGTGAGGTGGDQGLGGGFN